MKSEGLFGNAPLPVVNMGKVTGGEKLRTTREAYIIIRRALPEPSLVFAAEAWGAGSQPEAGLEAGGGPVGDPGCNPRTSLLSC